MVIAGPSLFFFRVHSVSIEATFQLDLAINGLDKLFIMKTILTLLTCCFVMSAKGQDTTASILPPRSEVAIQNEKEPTHLFFSPRLINANTVYMLPKGILQFKVTHHFNDIAGDIGGIKNFFGLDDAVDVRIGFQYGISRKVNLMAARYKGAFPVQKMYELGLKWLVLEQVEHESSRPISLALYGNAVVATMRSGTNPAVENFITEFSDRLSFMGQLMLAKKFGPVVLQLNPTLVHRNNALPYDEKTLFALGGATRIHLGGHYSLLLDYFHTFRSQASSDSFRLRDIKFHDVIGVGFEILTEGHVFQLNFTNATDILENRFVPRTVRTWGKGEFRWGFTVARDFDLFFKKKRK
jgi:hypothetical protein